MHEVDLRFLKAIDDSGLGTKIRGNMVVSAPNLNGIPKEQWVELLARHEDGLNYQKFRRYALEIHNIITQTLRRSYGTYSDSPTFEDREAEVVNKAMLPYMLKSRKEDASCY